MFMKSVGVNGWFEKTSFKPHGLNVTLISLKALDTVYFSQERRVSSTVS